MSWDDDCKAAVEAFVNLKEGEDPSRALGRDARDEFFFLILEEGVRKHSLSPQLKRGVLDFLNNLRENHFDA